MSKRGMGKVSFCDLQDKDGRIQLYARQDEMDEAVYKKFKKFDIVPLLLADEGLAEGGLLGNDAVHGVGLLRAHDGVGRGQGLSVGARQAKEYKMSQARYDELQEELNYLKTTRSDEVAEQIGSPDRPGRSGKRSKRQTHSLSQVPLSSPTQSAPVSASPLPGGPPAARRRSLYPAKMGGLRSCPEGLTFPHAFYIISSCKIAPREGFPPT